MMAKMNVATFLIGTISHKLPCDIGESERSLIINDMVSSWEDRKYYRPLPHHQTGQSVNHFSAEYHWGLRRD